MHTPFPPNPPCANHVAVVNEISTTVRVHGIAVVRIGDSADECYDQYNSSNVFTNEI